MAHYAIGDIQGCYDELEALLKKIGFNHGTDTLWLTGDIVNRGPKSLESLQFAMQHPDSVQTVLGNHDLHLLAVGCGEGTTKRSDTIDRILKHPDSKKMLDWLRSQPLMIRDGAHVMVHAGVLPQWSIDQAGELAHEAEEELRGKKYKKFFAKMYGNKPIRWREGLEGYRRLRFIINVFTRMRALTLENKMEFEFKSSPENMPPDLRPWFAAPDRQNLSHKIVFGHWSSLGYVNDYGVIALDTGALWGGALTAINLESGAVNQVASMNGLDWRSPTK